MFSTYSEVTNRQAELEKNATVLAYLLSKSLNKQVGIVCFLHEKLRSGWKENLKN